MDLSDESRYLCLVMELCTGGGGFFLTKKRGRITCVRKNIGGRGGWDDKYL